MNIGMIGIGKMGGAMARRLLAHGYAVAVYHRDAKRSEALRGLGATVARSIAEMASGCDLLITMLPNDGALEEVAMGAAGLCESMPAGTIHMVSGTHGIATMDKLMTAHRGRSQRLLACTVLGRPERAEDGKLGLITAGPQSAVEEVVPVLQVLGDRIFSAGENPLAAVAVKIANNFVLGCAIEAIGEGMALARKYQVEPGLFHTVLTNGLFNCIAYQSYGDIIAKEDWSRVGATAATGLKDAQLAFEAAERVQVPLPSGRVWRDHLMAACGRGEESLDWAVMARQQFRNSGLE